jgi:2'-phosphotransferase
MKRNHIHFAKGLPGDSGVISGMRQNAEVRIYIDVAKAMNAGYEFFESSNGVILCPGDENGTLPSKFFNKVTPKMLDKSGLV